METKKSTFVLGIGCGSDLYTGHHFLVEDVKDNIKD